MKTLPPVFFYLLFFMISGEDIDVWPLPNNVVLNENTLRLLPSTFNIRIKQSAEPHSILYKVVNRYQGLLFPKIQDISSIFTNNLDSVSNALYRNNIFENHFTSLPHNKPNENLPSLDVCVLQDSSPEFRLGDDESYTIRIDLNSSPEGIPVASLTALTVWGVLRGLETFSQLIVPCVFRENSVNILEYHIHNCPLEITDKPRFKWRGLLVDTSRHFLSQSSLKHILDAMSYQKLNTLHWHISDSESFPLKSDIVPQFAKNSVFTHNQIYSHETIKDIISYARNLGIRVMFELDTPGHTASWGQALPELTVDCWDWLLKNLPSNHIWNKITLDVSNSNTLKITKSLLRELTSLNPTERFVHIGGDEVSSECWSTSENIKTLMRDHDMAIYNSEIEQWVYNYTLLLGWWSGLLQEYVSSTLEKRSVVWEEAFSAGNLNSETIVSVWFDPSKLGEVIQANLYALLSFGWYVDRQSPSCVTKEISKCPNHWGFIDTWQDMYNIEPYDWIPANIPEIQLKKLLGGEISAWSETITSSVFDSVTWSRAIAVSERLWSEDLKKVDMNDPQSLVVRSRLNSFKCKLVQRGIITLSLESDYCQDFSNIISPHQLHSSLNLYIYILFSIITFLVFVIIFLIIRSHRIVANQRRAHSPSEYALLIE